jgi:hypothetical protein
MGTSQRYQRNEEIVYREEEDGAFLFNPDSGNLKYMNQSGRAAYLALDGQNDVNRLVVHLLELFSGVKRAQIEKDVEGFLRELEENGFISSSDKG